jgi:DNA-binding SARP family transcriptional activator/predicted ATPase/predicted negative regulator of RcsB-dependent stress response
MTSLKLFLFGSPRCELDGQPVEISLRKALAVLVYLAVTRQSYRRDALATMFWPDHDRSSARSNLRRVLYWISHYTAEGILKTSSEEVSTNPEFELWIDVHEFDAALEDSEAGEPERLGAAASLYTGHFLEGFTLPDSPSFDDWQFFEGDRLQQAYAGLLEQLVELHRKRGEYPPAIEYARRWLALDQLNETAHRALMALYGQAGQYSAALRQYETCARLLKTELGISPEPETIALYESLRRRELGPAPEPLAQPSTPLPEPTLPPPALTLLPEFLEEDANGEHEAISRTSPHNLAALTTPLLGRQQELEEVASLLASPSVRLLTITGPGGIGKTRLAQEAAWAVLDNQAELPDGVFFVPLSCAGSSAALAQAIAQALDFNFYADAEPPEKQVILYLSSKRLLLVLDNIEHLLDEAGLSLIVALLMDAPGVKLMVTSSTRLNIQREQLFPLTGLPLPEPDRPGETSEIDGALLLFQESARRVVPDFSLDSQNLPDAIRICQLLEGVPLGIELAGAWVGMLNPAEIAAEIAKSLDFLEAEWQDLPERHRSLRAVFESSWQLLSEDERNVLRRLAIFRGAFTRQAANEVAGADLRMLQALANKSWLGREESGRWQIHPLLRQYAARQLAAGSEEWEGVMNRHASYYSRLIEAAGEAIKGAGQKEAFDRIEVEFENVLVAWMHLLDENRFDEVLQMLFGMAQYCLAKTRVAEFWTWLETALVVAAQNVTVAGSRPLICAILALQGRLRFGYHHGPLGGQFAEDKDKIQRAFEMSAAFNARQEMGIWHTFLLVQYAWYIDREAGIEALRSLLESGHLQTDEWEQAYALEALGSLLRSLHSYSEAKGLLLDALEIYRRLGEPTGWGSTLRTLGAIAKEQQAYAEARAYLEEARQVSQQAGDWANLARVLWELGHISRNEARFAEAFDFFDKQRQAAARGGLRYLEAQALSTTSIEAIRYGDLETARQARQESMEISRQIDDPNGMAWSYWEMGEIYRVEGDRDSARRWYQKALDLFDERRINLGMAYYERGLGDLALQENDYPEAQNHFENCLKLSQGERNFWAASYALSGLGLAQIGLGLAADARKSLEQAMQLASEMGNLGLLLRGAAGMAALLTLEGDPAEAIRVSTLVMNQPAAWRETRAQVEAIQAEAAAQLTPDQLENARKLGQDAALSDLGFETIPLV